MWFTGIPFLRALCRWTPCFSSKISTCLPKNDSCCVFGLIIILETTTHNGGTFISLETVWVISYWTIRYSKPLSKDGAKRLSWNDKAQVSLHLNAKIRQIVHRIWARHKVTRSKYIIILAPYLSATLWFVDLKFDNDAYFCCYAT